ncbi:MAG: hypothetical protein N2D54_05365 [Chloroflexota bacterium]
MAAEKERLIEKNGIRINKIYSEVHQQIDNGDYSKAEGFDKGVNTLFSYRDRVNKAPTWPWDWGAIRGFFSAVFLPLVIWIIQSLLSQIIHQ